MEARYARRLIANVLGIGMVLALGIERAQAQTGSTTGLSGRVADPTGGAFLARPSRSKAPIQGPHAPSRRTRGVTGKSVFCPPALMSSRSSLKGSRRCGATASRFRPPKCARWTSSWKSAR